MKRYITIILLALLPMICFAQDHLKFMGIPMNMTINQFQSRLAEKGIKVSPDNKYSEEGSAILEGSFAHYNNARIVVDFIPTSKLVYMASVYVITGSKDSAESAIKNFYNSVTSECAGYYNVKTDSENGFAKYQFLIYNKNRECIGGINVGVMKHDVGIYSAYIYYMDSKNIEIYKQSNMK